MSRKADIDRFRHFVDTSRWRFAKTYAESYPHEYTLDEWCPDEEFESAIRCIERWGIEERFWSAERKYFYLDGRKYWHMGDASSVDDDERPGLINRSWLDVTRYAGNAKELGFDGEALDRLLSRWKMLLKKANRG